MNEKAAEKKVYDVLKMKLNNFAIYEHGFSFTVDSELDAYKAAYKYRYSKRVVVEYAPGVCEWLVHVSSD